MKETKKKVTVDRSIWGITGSYKKQEQEKDYSYWERFNYGEDHPEEFFGEKENFLLDPKNGRMCCLGFGCNQLCDIETSELEGKSMPDNLVSDLVDWVNDGSLVQINLDPVNKMYERGLSLFVVKDEVDSEVEFYGTNFAEQAAAINDKNILTSQEKEEQLIKLFGENGIELSFT